MPEMSQQIRAINDAYGRMREQIMANPNLSDEHKRAALDRLDIGLQRMVERRDPRMARAFAQTPRYQQALQRVQEQDARAGAAGFPGQPQQLPGSQMTVGAPGQGQGPTRYEYGRNDELSRRAQQFQDSNAQAAQVLGVNPAPTTIGNPVQYGNAPETVNQPIVGQNIGGGRMGAMQPTPPQPAGPTASNAPNPSNAPTGGPGAVNTGGYRGGGGGTGSAPGMAPSRGGTLMGMSHGWRPQSQRDVPVGGGPRSGWV